MASEHPEHPRSTPDIQAKALARRGYAFARLGNYPEAVSSLAQALKHKENAEWRREVEMCLGKLAKLQAKPQQLQKAQPQTQGGSTPVSNVPSEVGDRKGQVDNLSVAVGSPTTGDRKKAKNLVKDAQQSAEDAAEAREALRALAGVTAKPKLDSRKQQPDTTGSKGNSQSLLVLCVGVDVCVRVGF